MVQAVETDGGVTRTNAYVYDALDRRIKKTADATGSNVPTEYLWSGQDILAEYDGANHLLRRYIQGPGIDEPVAMYTYDTSGTQTGLKYYHQDALGSVVALSDSSGNLSEKYSYSTHGEVGAEGVEGNPFRYTGRQLDPEIGCYYYRARIYCPDQGRFLQTDPVGDRDSLNLYQYALWDPIINKDPFGECSSTDKFGTCNGNPSLGGADDSITVVGKQDPCGGNPMCTSYSNVITVDRMLADPPLMIPLFFNVSSGLLRSALGLTKMAAQTVTGAPDKAHALRRQIMERNGAPLPGYKGGRTFENRNGQLPPGGAYKEYDVNPTSAGGRDAERIVIDTKTGDAWYTSDHYTSFTPMQ